MKSFYPSEIVAISQSYNQGNHIAHWNNAEPKDYPIDECYGSSGRSGYFLAPFDCKVIKKYEANTKQIWIESLAPVDTPIGSDYVTVFIGHIMSDDYNKISVGDTFKQWDKILMEGIDRMATGYHNHISAGLGKITGTGWKKNNRNVWCLTTEYGAKKPEQLFYINTDRTTVKETQNLPFVYTKDEIQPEPTPQPSYSKGIYKTLDNMYIRKGPGTNYGKVKVEECTKAMQNALTSKVANNPAVVKKGREITALNVITNDDRSIWIKNYSGYICLQGQSGKIYLKFIK